MHISYIKIKKEKKDPFINKYNKYRLGNKHLIKFNIY